MSDLPIHQDEKQVPLSLEQRVQRNEKDILELARGVNLQASLLEYMIVAQDRVIQKYLSLIRGSEPKTGEPNVENPKN